MTKDTDGRLQRIQALQEARYKRITENTWNLMHYIFQK